MLRPLKTATESECLEFRCRINLDTLPKPRTHSLQYFVLIAEAISMCLGSMDLLICRKRLSDLFKCISQSSIGQTIFFLPTYTDGSDWRPLREIRRLDVVENDIEASPGLILGCCSDTIFNLDTEQRWIVLILTNHLTWNTVASHRLMWPVCSVHNGN